VVTDSALEESGSAEALLPLLDAEETEDAEDFTPDDDSELDETGFLSLFDE
jgi:hypothetical protein